MSTSLSAPAAEPAAREPWPAVRAAALGLILALVVGVMVTAFAWPAVSTAPRDVPVAVVGPEPAVQQVAAALSQAEPGALAVVPMADESAARSAIESRDVAGALVLGADGVTVLTAPGGGQSVAALLEGVGDAVGTQLLAARGVQVPAPATAEVVVPGGTGDTYGVGFPTMVLPLVMSALLIGTVTSLAVRGAGARLVTLLVAAPLAGGIGALVAGTWLDVVPATWGVAGVVALGVLAVSGAVTGAHAVLGRVGVAVVAPAILLLGNPLSAAATSPQMLPDGWASLGQALPPGALVQALRSVAFFDGAAAGFPLMVLALWAGCGVALVAAGRLGARRQRLSVATAQPEVREPVGA
ncbi:MAG: hypothetical protein KQH57_16125 [Actinomycetales bacterium]|nr:hypothetical protein [Actinomycetales bacterium]